MSTHDSPGCEAKLPEALGPGVACVEQRDQRVERARRAEGPPATYGYEQHSRAGGWLEDANY